MYARRELRDAGNAVYLANFTTGTQMHHGICNESEPMPDAGKLPDDSNHFKSVTCLVPSLQLFRRAVRHVLCHAQPRMRHINAYSLSRIIK